MPSAHDADRSGTPPVARPADASQRPAAAAPALTDVDDAGRTAVDAAPAAGQERAAPAQAASGDEVRTRLKAALRRVTASALGVSIVSGLRKADRALFPLRNATAMVRRQAEYHARSDAASAAAAALPDGEAIGLRCAWVAEVYPAGHVARLTRTLRALGFSGRTPLLPFDQTEYFTAGRVSGQYLSATNLGYLVPTGVQAWPPTSAATSLPDGVESVFLTLVNTFPSATVLVAQFRFAEEAARSIERPFRTHYATTVRREGRVTTIPSGTHLRDEAIQRVQADLRGRCER